MYTKGIDNLSAYRYISAYTDITEINVMSDAGMEEEPKMEKRRWTNPAARRAVRVKEGWR
jgi:hypothetical protein